MAKTNITISDAAQRYIDDRINADHIATRAIALSITTCGAPRVYTGNITETRIFIKRGENVDEAIAKAFGIEDEQDTNEPESNEEQEDTMSNETTTPTTDFSIGAEIFIDDNTDENGNATRDMELYLVGSADRVSVFTVRVNDDAELLTIPRGGNVEAYINFAVDALFVTHDVDD